MNGATPRLLMACGIVAFVFGASRVIAGEIVQKQLSASNGSEGDEFGSSVAVHGDTIVVGAISAGPTGKESGAAYIFSRNDDGSNNWREVTALRCPDGEEGDNWFGVSVAINIDMVVVGAAGVDSYSGAAYLFSRNQGGAGRWGQVARLRDSDAGPGNGFGTSVGICRETVAIGAVGVHIDHGKACVFSQNHGGPDHWGQVAKLLPGDGKETALYFGSDVAIHADTVVVGTYGSSAVYVYSRNQRGPEKWGQTQKLTDSDMPQDQQNSFGDSVAVHGDIVVVGAPRANGATQKSGAAYVFSRNQGGTEEWGKIAKLAASDGLEDSGFGSSVAIHGDTVIVGAPEADGMTPKSGAAYVFSRNHGGTDNWGQLAKLTASDSAKDDWLARSVGVDGDTVIVGARRNDVKGEDSGAAYVFSGIGSSARLTEVARIAAFGARARAFGEQGVEITAVVPNSAAAGAGFEPHDVILQINGRPINSERDYSRAVDQSGPSMRVRVRSGRDGRILSVVVPLGKRHQAMPDPRNSRPKQVVFGARGQATGAQGVRVTAVVPNSPADKAGFETNDVILQINGRPIRSEAEYGIAIDQSGSLMWVRVQSGRDGKVVDVQVRLNK